MSKQFDQRHRLKKKLVACLYSNSSESNKRELWAVRNRE